MVSTKSLKAQIGALTDNTFKGNKLISSEAIKNEIVVLPELEAFISPLTVDEGKALEASLIKMGCRSPLIVWKTNKNILYAEQSEDSQIYVLIDGHNRYKFCKKNDIDFQIDIQYFDTIEEVKDFMIDFQIGRRNLTPEQTSYFRGLKYNRMKGKVGGDRVGETYDTSEVIAKEYNVSKKTIKRDGKYAEGLDKIDLVLKNKVLIGKEKIEKKIIEKLAKLDLPQKITSIDDAKSLSIEIEKKENKIGEGQSALKLKPRELNKLLGLVKIMENGQYFIPNGNFELTTEGIILK